MALAAGGEQQQKAKFTKRTPGPDGFTGELEQTLKEKNNTNSTQSSQEKKQNRNTSKPI